MPRAPGSSSRGTGRSVASTRPCRRSTMRSVARPIRSTTLPLFSSMTSSRRRPHAHAAHIESPNDGAGDAHDDDDPDLHPDRHAGAGKPAASRAPRAARGRPVARARRPSTTRRATPRLPARAQGGRATPTRAPPGRAARRSADGRAGRGRSRPAGVDDDAGAARVRDADRADAGSGELDPRGRRSQGRGGGGATITGRSP